MNTAWLTQLAPDRAPATVGWWPPAAGWWLLLLLALLAAALLVRAHRQPRRRQRRAALHELARLRRAGTVATAQAIQQLLRRYAVAVCGRERVARLSGDAWLAFIDERGHFGTAAARALVTIAYSGRDPGDSNHWRKVWMQSAARFIRRPAVRPARNTAPAGTGTRAPARTRTRTGTRAGTRAHTRAGAAP